MSILSRCPPPSFLLLGLRVSSSPLMVASLGRRSSREAPLRTGGTRGLPERGMPQCSSLLHQIWLSHCVMHKQRSKHTIVVSIRTGKRVQVVWLVVQLSTSCLWLIPVRAKEQNEWTCQMQLHCYSDESRKQVLSGLWRHIQWITVHPSAVKRSLHRNALKATRGDSKWKRL